MPSTAAGAESSQDRIPAVPAGTRGVELNRTPPGRRVPPHGGSRRPGLPGSDREPTLASQGEPISPSRRSADSRRELPIARPFPSPPFQARRPHRVAGGLDPRSHRAGRRRHPVHRRRRGIRSRRVPRSERVNLPRRRRAPAHRPRRARACRRAPPHLRARARHPRRTPARPPIRTPRRRRFLPRSSLRWRRSRLPPRRRERSLSSRSRGSRIGCRPSLRSARGRSRTSRSTARASTAS